MNVLQIQGHVRGKIRSYERKNKKGSYCIIKLKINDPSFPKRKINLVYYGSSAKIFSNFLESGSKLTVYKAYKIHDIGLNFLRKFRTTHYYVTSFGIG